MMITICVQVDTATRCKCGGDEDDFSPRHAAGGVLLDPAQLWA